MGFAVIVFFSNIGGILAVGMALSTGTLSLWLITYFFGGSALGGLIGLGAIVIKYLNSADGICISAKERPTA